MTKILLVDDDQNLLAVMKKVLTAKGGAEVCTESDSTRALQTAKAFRPDIVILDLQMPGMDGGDVAQALHENAMTKDTPVIFLTSLSTRAEALGHRDSPAHEYMVAKPVGTTELIRHIEKRMGRKLGRKVAS